ncbi:hypothetical protein [Pseudarthrobacter sp. BIM B-2242]|uniref:hypothetical protein n=1 Tax=Pseudarthrobacter sp. BIM B-2242 TaxID=2772401 RepID=UPI00168A7A9E|nr:hypothetical protein [Pseudarthrobacter sp. BIM B-2242]QOD05777.1 hypothetical protein IDT60_22335 [Pseudarthrobacter sp. BIM B-2242]
MSPVAHKPAGQPSGGQFTAVAHPEGSVTLTSPSGAGQSAEWHLERGAINAIYTAGRGFGRNRYGNPERIQEAYDASAAYLAGVGLPLSQAEIEARAKYVDLCAGYEADKGTLDDRTRRTRQYEAARQANWIIEYRHQAQNKAAREARAIEGATA